MNKILNTVIVTFLTIYYGISTAAASDRTGPSFNDIVPEYDSIRRLPIDGLNMVEVDGRVIYTSTNGRFVFMGAELYDTFNRRKLQSAEEINEYASKINLDAMGIDHSLLGAVSLGTGSENVTMFVDPQCGYCAKMLSQVVDNSALWEKYTFNVVTIPMLGQTSRTILNNMTCARESGELTNEEFVGRLARKDYSNLKVYTKACDNGALERASVTAKLLGARGVPFVIAGSGKYINAMPPDIAKFLAANGAGS